MPSLALRLRTAYPLLLLASAACNPAAFDDLLSKETSAADAAASDAGIRPDASRAPDATLPGVMDAASDAATARDASSAVDANGEEERGEGDSGANDGGSDAGQLVLPDLCGQIRPATPAQSGIDPNGGVTFPGALPQNTLLLSRAVSDVSRLGDRYWWLFTAAFKLNSLLLENTDSLSAAPLASPYELAEVQPDAGVPTSWLPALDADRAQLEIGEQLEHLTGNVIATGLSDGLAFYTPGALSGSNNVLVLRPLGTRVATVHVDNDGAHATPLPDLLFGASAPSFRYGLRAEEFIYLYGCPRRDSDGMYSCLLARAPVSEATQAASYKFRTTGGWSNDLSAASVVLDNARDDISVSWNPYLQRYLAVHLVWINAKLRLSTAPRPEGPWEQFAEIALPPPEGGQISHFAGVEHPELASRCGRQLVLTYLHARATNSEVRRIEVTLL